MGDLFRMSYKKSSYKVINKCFCGCVISENKTYCYMCLNKVYNLIDKQGFRNGKNGLNGYLFKEGLINPTEYNNNKKLNEEDFLNKNMPLMVNKLKEEVLK